MHIESYVVHYALLNISACTSQIGIRHFNSLILQQQYSGALFSLYLNNLYFTHTAPHLPHSFPHPSGQVDSGIVGSITY